MCTLEGPSGTPNVCIELPSYFNLFQFILCGCARILKGSFPNRPRSSIARKYDTNRANILIVVCMPLCVRVIGIGDRKIQTQHVVGLHVDRLLVGAPIHGA